MGEIQCDTLCATVKVPRMNTEIDVYNVQRLPYFRLIVALRAISDFRFDEVVKCSEPIVPAKHGVSEVVTGEWFPSENVLQEQTIEVCMSEEMKSFMADEVSLVPSMANEFGKVGFTGQPQEVKYASCGKVLKVG